MCTKYMYTCFKEGQFFHKNTHTSQLSLLWGSTPSIRSDGGTFRFFGIRTWPKSTKKSTHQMDSQSVKQIILYILHISTHRWRQRYTEITQDPVPFSVVQEIFWLSWENLSQYVTVNRGGRGECVLSYSLGCSQVAQLLVYNADSPFVIVDLNCTVYVQLTPSPPYVLYNFSCNGNGYKNFLRPCNRDVLHRRVCEDSDKIP